MAELIQLRKLYRAEANELGYSDIETNKFVTEQLELHLATEERRRQHELEEKRLAADIENKRLAIEQENRRLEQERLQLEYNDKERERQAQTQIRLAELAANTRQLDNELPPSPGTSTSWRPLVLHTNIIWIWV